MGEKSFVFSVGKTYKSFCEFYDEFDLYCKAEKEVFNVGRSDLLESSSFKDLPNANKLQYLTVTFKCKYGPTTKQPGTRGTGQRATNSYNHGCRATLALKLNSTLDSLIITNVHLEHNNHPEGYKEFYYSLPENRRLPPHVRQEVLKNLKLKADNQYIKNELARANIIVSNKDISNLKAGLKQPDGNNLKRFVDKLKHEYECNVSLLYSQNDKLTKIKGKNEKKEETEKKKNFQGLYFSTKKMRQSMSSWPEIIFMDGTYKLFILGFILFLLIAQNGLGRAEVVGVAIIKSEDSETFRWIANMFNTENEVACKKMQCIMSDKDMTARNEFKKVFPHVTLYQCIFHTSQTFSRTVKSMPMSKEEKSKSLELLQKIIYCNNEEYDELYEELKEFPLCLVEYYDKNWHGYGEEWRAFNMRRRNLGHQTNNVNESANKQIKKYLRKRSTLDEFGTGFFEYYNAQDQETNIRRAVQNTRRPNNCFLDDFEQDYYSYLTLFSFNKIKNHFSSFNQVKIHEEKDGLFSIICEKEGTQTTATSCSCCFYESNGLPCQHIFAVRNFLKLPLFSPDLCDERWTRKYDLIQMNIRKDDDTFMNASNLQTTFAIKPKSKAKNIHQRRAIIKPYANQILELVSYSSGQDFENNIGLLEEFINHLRQGRQHLNENLKINENDNIVESIQKLEIIGDEEEKSNDQILNDISMPSPIHLKGRVSGSFTVNSHYRATKK